MSIEGCHFLILVSIWPELGAASNLACNSKIEGEVTCLLCRFAIAFVLRQIRTAKSAFRPESCAIVGGSCVAECPGAHPEAAQSPP